MKQNDSKYHQLYLMLQDADDYYPKEDRKELLDLIKELHSDNEDLLGDLDDYGRYGIRFKTIGEDSFHADTDEQFFRTKSKRDNVFDDWINDRCWDSIFNQELQYRTPGLNIHDIEKVFKESCVIYTEKEK